MTSKGLLKHLQKGDAPAPAVALSPAAAWPFPRLEDEAVKVEAPTDDVAIEDQRSIANEQRKTKRATKAKK
jgi:hypothetical protein